VSLSVTIQGRLPQLANGRMFWATRAKLVKGIKENVWAQMVTVRNEAGQPKAMEPRTLRITAYVCGRAFDMDNLVANSKPIVDAAVASGWLAEDSPQWMSLEVTQKRVAHRSEERIVIEVSDG